jgi:hypothetical protein
MPWPTEADRFMKIWHASFQIAEDPTPDEHPWRVAQACDLPQGVVNLFRVVMISVSSAIFARPRLDSACSKRRFRGWITHHSSARQIANV